MRFLPYNEYSQPKGWNHFLLTWFQSLGVYSILFGRKKYQKLRRPTPPHVPLTTVVSGVTAETFCCIASNDIQQKFYGNNHIL